MKLSSNFKELTILIRIPRSDTSKSFEVRPLTAGITARWERACERGRDSWLVYGKSIKYLRPGNCCVVNGERLLAAAVAWGCQSEIYESEIRLIKNVALTVEKLRAAGMCGRGMSQK